MSPEYRKGCPVCVSPDVAVFTEIPEVPIHCNLLWPTRDQAIHAPRGDIRLGFCSACGHVFNLAFNPSLLEYTQAYENSLHFSPLFQQYANSLAMELIERHRLYGKTIIEIGCGKGEFLKLLCRLGGNRGIGFDPSYIQERDAYPCGKEITFIPDFFSERYADYKADLFCCRQVLEHVTNAREFVGNIRRGIGDASSNVFFEVPNVLFMLRDLSIWDIIYEHVSYFSLSSLAHLFASCGFVVCRLSRSYADQFLCIEASSGGSVNNTIRESREDRKELSRSVASFAEKYREKIEVWGAMLENIETASRRAVVWGAGSKGVMFLNLLKNGKAIEYVVDINPQKQGMYVAGTGQEIVSPNFLRTYRPDVVIVMNSIYQSEIQRLTESLGLEPEFTFA
jgi:2-polyprenyl-3-methyl-5-hydroxy-6-metoxy-1,4-benzoquinol methylase